MAVIHGRNLLVRLNSTAIAGSRSCSLTIKSDLLEVSSPNDGKYRHFIEGRQEWNIKCLYLVIDNSYINFPMMVGQSVMIEFVDRNGQGLIGTAIIEQCEISSSIGNLAQGNFTFRGNGELSAKYNLLPSLTSGWEGETGGTVEYNGIYYGIRSVSQLDLYTPAIYRYHGDHLCFSLDSASFVDVTFCYIHNHNWTNLSDIYDNGQKVT